MKVNIFFYMPEAHLPSPDRRAAWLPGQAPDLLAGGKSAAAQCWIYQTWVELQGDTKIELVTKMPDEGIIVTLGGVLHKHFEAGEKQFIANIVADFVPHPGTHLQIVQNRTHARRLPGSVFIPLWPQPNIVPRDPARGDRLETVAFFGDPGNLAPELANVGFASDLERETGARFVIRDASQWHDFSDVDVALAIRDFSHSQHLHKPATKLYNAWLAGVPVIAGSDSAFAAEGLDGKDFLRAHSSSECIKLVKKLQGDRAFRQNLVASGKKRTAPFSREAVTENWRLFCEEKLPATAAGWFKKSPVERRIFWLTQRLIFFLDRKIRS